MKTLIVLECERYIQPFMRAMLNVAQGHYDKIIIITNPLHKGDSINSDKVSHIEIDNKTRKKSIISAPLRLFSTDAIRQITAAISKGKFNKEYLDILKVYLCYGRAFYLKAKPYVEEGLKNGDVHVLSCWFSVEALSAALLKKKFPTIRAFSLAHSFEIDPLKNKFVDLTFNCCKHKYLDKIYFISTKMRDIYNENTQNMYVQEYKQQMDVSYLGCIKLFDDVNPYHDDGKIKFVSCSYVRPEKRIDLIMDVMSRWTLCPIKWTHLGNGSLLEEMQQRANETMKANKYVEIDLKGYVSNEDVQKMYITEPVDMFINLSSSEGVPVAIMEAIAYGIPVVATDVGGVSEIIEDEHGLLIGADDNAETIKCALELFVKKYQQDANGKRNAAYSFWESHFDAKSNYEKFFSQLGK